MSERIVFFGNERLASGCTTDAPILRSLIEADYDIAYLVVKQARQSGRRQRQLEVLELAEKHGIEVLQTTNLKDIEPTLAASGASVGVLAAFGMMVPENIMQLFPHGILNIHPSLLPKYRGSTPIESAILNADSETGVCLMQLVKAMDAGPIWGVSRLELDGTESKQELADTLGATGAAMLTALLPELLNGTIVAAEQDDDSAEYVPMLSREDAELDFNKSAEQLTREIRAYLGWPGSRTELADKEVVVTAAHAVDVSGPAGDAFVHERLPAIYTSNDALVIDRLKPAGKGEMSGEAFLAGNSL